MSFYTPSVRLRRYTQLTPALLREMGIRGIITDLDDTLAARNVFLPDEEVSAWITGLTEAGIKVCIVSNNHKKRTQAFSEPLEIPYFYEALKPSKKAILKALDVLDLPLQEVALLGDQLFTDMTAATRCKIKGILVDPVGSYGGWFVHFKRKLEIPLRKKIPYDFE
ncbi:MAG: YqeG family HAD IIIA-type phosphatase [Clostridia bacterium]|nr:YqeG family HAD IIIA-type phosphatase [Clostridia bacterium]